MGCKLLEIMVDGLYAVFHGFEAFHRWPVYCWMSIQRSSCFFNLCSSCSSRSNKGRRDCLLPPPRGWLCCRAGLTARRTPIVGQAIPPLTHTPCYSVATAASRRSQTSEPSYSSPHGHPLLRLPQLHIVPFLGLAVVHRPGALGAAWSTWKERVPSDVDCTWRG